MRVDNAMRNLASMKRINTAADDPAGMAIAEKMNSQTKGLDQAIENTHDAINLANTADGALDGMQEQIQRMRELALQASNGTLTDSDRGNIQEEINQIKESINNIGQNTEFNTMKLLDGSFQDKNIANTPNGQGTPMSIENSSLDALGIQDFDVTGDFDITDLDAALEKVSSTRADIGAQTAGFESSIRANETARQNTLSAQTQIEDLDVAKGVMDLKRTQILDQYRLTVQKRSMQQEGNLINSLL